MEYREYHLNPKVKIHPNLTLMQKRIKDKRKLFLIL
jgi:hypothetical protein